MLHNVVVIENVGNKYGKTIKADIAFSLVDEPMDIQDAEDWEDKVVKLNIPYTLVHARLRRQGHGENWEEGYFILLQKEDLLNYFSFHGIDEEGLSNFRSERSMKRYKMGQKQNLTLAKRAKA